MTRTLTKKMAFAVSAVTFPLLMPTYAVAIVFTFSYLRNIDNHVLLMVLAVTFAVTALMPAFGIWVLYKLGRIKDWALNQQSERLYPFIFTIVAYLAVAWYFAKVHAPLWMSQFMLGAAIALTLAAIINIRWKISGHAMGMGGLTAMAFFLAHSGLLLVGGYLLPLGLFVLSGFVATCRLLLDRHTLGQVAAGFALGFSLILLSMIL